ncbi:trypsin-like peptidase domain-containing protein [Desulfococcaceae bacterium HSG9]|nr:trypsin-like peptidase domain-containing protein [Desulfococcaceae bacterium HSG9]
MTFFFLKRNSLFANLVNWQMIIVISLIAAVFAGHLYAAEPFAPQIRNSVVRISIIKQEPDYKIPWSAGSIGSGIGTGFLIKNRRILTNAHVAGNARFIAVEKEGDSRKYEAKVKFIANDCDLAVLEVKDPAFFNEMTPLNFGGTPPLDSAVTVIGYPIGGNHLSFTRGVVSRIDYQVYSHSSVDSHLAIQIDAAINPGNSGGPVLQNGKVVGVAFQAYSGAVAQNVGYMIPNPVIQRFLTDIEDGNYDHYVDLGIYFFPLLNSAHRRALGLLPGDYGVVISNVITAGAAGGSLKIGDVLLAIDDLPIFSNGYVEMDGQRVLMAEVVERKFKGNAVRLKILRNRKEMQVTLRLNSPWPYLMTARRHGVRPRFVVHAGLVFQPLSYNFVKDANIKNPDLLYHYSLFLGKELYLKRPEIIVLSKILPDPINADLRSFTNSIIDKINNRKIRTLEDVATAFKSPTDYDVIQMLGRGRPIVLERKAVDSARKRILTDYGVLSEEYLGDSIIPKNWMRSKVGALPLLFRLGI